MTSPRDLLLHSARPDGDGPLITMGVDQAGWDYTSLTVVTLGAGGTWQGETGPDEVAFVPLGGRCVVEAADGRWTIGDRASVFHGQPWVLYLPIGEVYRIDAVTDLELAICGARAEERHDPAIIRPEAIEVEIRGGGNAARQINHIVAPAFAAHRLLVVEVFTPSGNWSSYPPHKHDVSRMPLEADLEEIYYYRIDPPEGFGLQRLYTADGAIDEAYVIKDGDLLLVPEGYHTFAAAQGSTGYYLNVLAGNEPVRTMQPVDDPAYAWVRDTWRPEMNGGSRSWRDIDRWVNRGAGDRGVR